jgi:hypothetical protein
MSKSLKRPQANGADKNPPAAVPTQSIGAFKIRAAGAYLGGLSVPSMHRLVARGLLKPNRALRHLLFSREELDRFLREG